MTSILLRLASFIILSLPLLIEVYRERNGEKKEEHRTSFLIRINLLVHCAGLASCISVLIRNDWQGYLHFNTAYYLPNIFMSFAIFLLLFDYSIAATLEKRGVIKKGSSWFNYLSSSDFDTWKPWVRIGSTWRFIVKLVVFAIALILWL